MKTFKTVEVGMVGVNCYLVPAGDGDRLYIIDPGADAEHIIAAAGTFEFKKAIILLTHAHADHIGAVREVMDRFNIDKVYLHPDDRKLYFSPDNHLLPYIPPARNLPEPTDNITGEDFTVIPTPGHSRGGVCFYFNRIPALFSGDTIFAGSIGRSDLPGGDLNTLLRSIKEKIMTLPGELEIYPGHGTATTVAFEQRNNPFL